MTLQMSLTVTAIANSQSIEYFDEPISVMDIFLIDCVTVTVYY